MPIPANGNWPFSSDVGSPDGALTTSTAGLKWDMLSQFGLGSAKHAKKETEVPILPMFQSEVQDP